MQTRSLLILAIATTAAVAAAVALDTGGAPPAATNAQGPLVPGLLARVNDVATVEVRGPDGAVTIARQPSGVWGVAEKGGYPADADRVKAAVVGLAQATIVEPRTALPDLHPRIGVEEPDRPGAASRRLTLKDTGGAEMASVIIGKTATAGSGGQPSTLYARRSGEAESWLIRAPLPPLEPEAARWADRTLPRILRDRVASVEIRQPGGAAVTLSRPDPGQRTFAAAGLPDGAAAKPALVDETTGVLGYIAFEDVARAEPAWFAEAPVTTVRTFDGAVLAIRTANREDGAWIAIEAAFDADRAKAHAEANIPAFLPPDEMEKTVHDWRSRFDGWAYRIYDAAAETLTRAPEEFVETEG